MLDTNIIIFCIRHPESACAERVEQHVGKDIFISVVTYAELIFGVKNSKYLEQNMAALRGFLFGIPTLPFDTDAGYHYGELLAKLKREGKDRQNQDRDKMIAAHAISRGMVLVTNNTKDFNYIDGLEITDWREKGDLEGSVG